MIAVRVSHLEITQHLEPAGCAAAKNGNYESNDKTQSRSKKSPYNASSPRVHGR